MKRLITQVKKRLQPERAERFAFMDWVKFNPFIKKHLIAIPNEGKRHKITGKNLKRMGLVKGAPDYFLLIPTERYHGLWIEFKAGKRKLDKDQEQFFATAKEQRYECVVVYSAKEAIDEIKEYLKET